MTNEFQSLIDRYFSWLRDKTSLRQVGSDWVEITTPYLDRHNDYIQLYARREDGGYLLTDDGYTITDLAQSGCKLDSPKRQDLLQMTLAGFGVRNQKDALEIHTSIENFPIRKHNLVQAILAVNDLFYVAVPMIASLFYEDVVQWLDVSNIRYTPDIKLTGKSGFDHHFQFVIPKSRAQPERVVEAITRPTRVEAGNFIFKWLDTRGARASDSRAYAILNDQDQRVSSQVIEAFSSYEVKPVPWSERDDLKEELAA